MQDEDSAFVEIDYYFWRTGCFSQMFNQDNTLKIEPDYSVIKKSCTGFLFNTDVARETYFSLTVYLPGNEYVLLTSARADAWITTSIDLIRIQDGKVVKGNSKFQECSVKLLPRCLETIKK